MDTNTRSTRSGTCFAAAAVSLFALSACLAGLSARADAIEETSVTVKYGDLNLGNPQGANTLYRRIVAAAHEVCQMPSGSVAYRWGARTCLARTIAKAVTEIGSPQLAAVYNANSTEPLPLTVAKR